VKDLSHHLLDILENSATAGATAACIRASWRGAWLDLEITDNGPGFPARVRADPTDAFATTRTDRPAGLGLTLLRAAAEKTGGGLEPGGLAGSGVLLRATFDLSHPDAQPLGELEDALCAAMLSWPGLELEVRIGPDHREVLDTRAVKERLDGVEIGNPRVQSFLRQLLKEELAPLYDWAAAIPWNGGVSSGKGCRE